MSFGSPKTFKEPTYRRLDLTYHEWNVLRRCVEMADPDQLRDILRDYHGYNAKKANAVYDSVWDKLDMDHLFFLFKSLARKERSERSTRPSFVLALKRRGYANPRKVRIARRLRWKEIRP